MVVGVLIPCGSSSKARILVAILAAMDVSKYSHSPVCKAVITYDYAILKCILDSLPCLANSSEIRIKAASIAEEDKADVIFTIINCPDIPTYETTLLLTIKLADAPTAEMLMVAGADWSLQNEQGRSALKEAICTARKPQSRSLPPLSALSLGQM